MKKTLLAACMCIAFLPSAMAWDAQTGGSGPQAIGQDGGSATAQAQHQRQQQRQAQHQAQHQSQTATGGSARATGGISNVSISGLGGGSSAASSSGGRAPDVFIPSVGGGGSDCPTVGFGAGGSGLGGGGGFGPSWISSDCNKRRVADLLSHLYGPAVARAYAEQNIDGVAHAVAVANSGSHTDPAAQHPAWCTTNKGVWLRDLPECGDKPR